MGENQERFKHLSHIEPTDNVICCVHDLPYCDDRETFLCIDGTGRSSMSYMGSTSKIGCTGTVRSCIVASMLTSIVASVGLPIATSIVVSMSQSIVTSIVHPSSHLFGRHVVLPFFSCFFPWIQPHAHIYKCASCAVSLWLFSLRPSREFFFCLLCRRVSRVHE